MQKKNKGESKLISVGIYPVDEVSEEPSGQDDDEYVVNDSQEKVNAKKVKQKKPSYIVKDKRPYNHILNNYKDFPQN